MRNSYSQPACFQDIFAYFVNNEQPGYFIDIGCQGPANYSNVKLLLENNWKGSGIDIDDYKELWNNYSTNMFFHQGNATIKEDIDIIFSQAPKIVDFLSLDVDEYGYDALTKIDFDKFRFKCITIEHDYYRFGETLRTPQRHLLDNLGYTRVINTVAEDWYVDMNLIDIYVKTLVLSVPKHDDLIGASMNNILEWFNLK